MKYRNTEQNKISQGKQGRGCGIHGTIRFHRAGRARAQLLKAKAGALIM